MDSSLVCRINPFCKRLQAGIICPHMQAIPASHLHMQQLPPLHRSRNFHQPLQLPPISPVQVFPQTRVVAPPPSPTSPVMSLSLSLSQPRPIRAIAEHISRTSPQNPEYLSQPVKLLPRSSSSFRPILIRQRVTY